MSPCQQKTSALSQSLFKGIAVCGGILGTSVLMAYAAQAIEVTDPETQFTPGSFACMSNPSYLCQRPSRFSSPWRHLPGDFKQEAHTSPLTMEQQGELGEAMNEHSNDLQPGNFACQANTNSNCM
jgi:hypothetical protein